MACFICYPKPNQVWNGDDVMVVELAGPPSACPSTLTTTTPPTSLKGSEIQPEKGILQISIPEYQANSDSPQHSPVNAHAPPPAVVGQLIVNAHARPPAVVGQLIVHGHNLNGNPDEPVQEPTGDPQVRP